MFEAPVWDSIASNAATAVATTHIASITRHTTVKLNWTNFKRGKSG